MNNLISKIQKWAEDRNLIKGSSPQKQYLKFVEELGELCAGISKNNIELIKDSLGDCFVVLTIMAKQQDLNFKKCLKLSLGVPNIEDHEAIIVINRNIIGLVNSGDNPVYLHDFCEFVLCALHAIAKNHNVDFKECVEGAWDEIKDRKGKMIDGLFVKESDL